MHDQEAMNVWCVLLRPYSRGSIKLRSTNPLHHPLIESNSMADPRDVQVLVDGMKFPLTIKGFSTKFPWSVKLFKSF